MATGSAAALTSNLDIGSQDDAGWDPASVADRLGPVIYETAPLHPTHDLPIDTRLQRHPQSFHRSRARALVAAREHALEHGYDMTVGTTMKRGQGQEWVQLHCHRRGPMGSGCGYTCWLKHEGHARWRIDSDGKEHSGHSPALSIGPRFWRSNVLPEELNDMDRMWRLGFAAGPARARRVLNVLRDRAQKPHLLDGQALDRRWQSMASFFAICVRPPWHQHQQQPAASSSSTTPAAATATPLAAHSPEPRDGRQGAPTPSSSRHSEPASNRPAAVSPMDSPDAPLHSATRFGTAPPVATPSTAGSSPAAAAASYERQAGTEQPRDQGIRDPTRLNGTHLNDTEERSHSFSSSSTTAAATSGSGHLVQVQARPEQADAEQPQDEVVRNAEASDAQPAAAQQVENQDTSTSNANGASIAPGSTNNGGGGGSEPGQGEGGGGGGGGAGGGGGDGGGNPLTPAPPSSSSAPLLQAVQSGPHLGFLSPCGVSFGRIFDPRQSWSIYETYAETPEDSSKVLPASTQNVDVAASSLLPGGGRLMRVKPTVWVLVRAASTGASNGA